MKPFCLGLILVLGLPIFPQTGRRQVRADDLPPAIRSLFPDFLSAVRDIEKSAASRLQEGEEDHLIFYLLQSRSFTKEPRIEPALSAKEFHDGGAIAAPVRRRIADFLHAKRSSDERFAYFREALHPDRAMLLAEYSRAMRFLYAKEFGLPKTLVSELYQSRGFSTDTQIEANYAVWSALAVVKAGYPGLRLNHVLIVGPGLDFAPRMDFFDDLPPQSYQPFAVADALLGMGLTETARMQIHCVDINPRVVNFLNALRSQPSTPLKLVSRPADEAYARYYAAFGAAIGTRRAGTRDSILVGQDVLRAITSERLNIVTQRITTEKFDAIVVTNVLLYFDKAELALAMANMQAMLEPGAFLITNDLRPDSERFARLLNMPPVQARTLRMGGSWQNPLFDGFVVFRNNPPGLGAR